METLQLAKEYNLHLCIKCGKCTSACPIPTLVPSYEDLGLPRILIEEINLGYKIFDDFRLWICMRCNVCFNGCPQGVKYEEFISKLRELCISKNIKAKFIRCKICSRYIYEAWVKDYMKDRLKLDNKDWPELDLCLSCKKRELGQKLRFSLPERSLNKKTKKVDKPLNFY